MVSQATASVFSPLADRSDRLRSIIGDLRLIEDFPLLKVSRLSESAIARLQTAVNFYLWTSLSSYFTAQRFVLDSDILTRYPNDVLSLPNITPNGLMLPKQENFLAYNEVHRQVASIFLGLGIGRHVDSIHAPVNIRIVDGTPDPKKAARPRAATKPHSDIWAGENASAIMVFIPLLGDISKANVRFMEPEDFPKSYVRPLEDFNEGRELAARATVYDCELEKGKIYFCDPFLLHQTILHGLGIRLSIDFRFLARETLPSDYSNGESRKTNYVSLDDWGGFGINRLVTTDARLEPFTGGDDVRNSYAAPYKFVEI